MKTPTPGVFGLAAETLYRLPNVYAPRQQGLPTSLHDIMKTDEGGDRFHRIEG